MSKKMRVSRLAWIGLAALAAFSSCSDDDAGSEDAMDELIQETCADYCEYLAACDPGMGPSCEECVDAFEGMLESDDTCFEEDLAYLDCQYVSLANSECDMSEMVADCEDEIQEFADCMPDDE